MRAADTRASPKRKQRLLQRCSQELGLLASYHVSMPKELNIAGWQREAARLVFEYLRTGREIHRLAFVRHIDGMLMRFREARTER